MGGIKIITKNKRASFDFHLDEKFEAGLALQGTEVKSLRDAKCSMNEAFCTIDKNNEVWVNQMHIAPYQFGTYDNHKETRKRKLLLNAKEIKHIQKSLATKGQTLIPTKIYFKGSKVKIEIALAKGKKLFDKRESTKKKEIERKLKQGKFE
ncbi:MAG: SsrA-binding protein SmpB [Bacteriovoracaceae bacterium]|jgi:SsrA-binding protein|nr:SsrA-binding protein [Halobacteriovoraceae bacterium]MDP7321642.1 SsrA-binding protein SmpB [Bacteriovoracaceae bacterium]|tara:strand:- start:151 stop:603 length:453 start_codon:yes stop_codon:yes gene_type:complete